MKRRFFPSPTITAAATALVAILASIVYRSAQSFSSQPTAPIMSTARISRQALKAILSIETPEGAGATVRRSIGTREVPNFTPFLMLDHFRVPKGAGFPDHPHRGMTTLTYLLQGEFEHEDFLGHKGRLGAGDLQFMIAGRGILHAEMPLHEEGMPEPMGLQLWIDLPAEHKLVAPSYQELSSSSIPSAHPPSAPSTTIKVICGTAEGNAAEGMVSSPVRSLGGCWFLDFEMLQSGESVWQELPVGWNAFIYTLTGSLLIGPSTTATAPFYTTLLSSGPTSTGLNLTSAAPNTRFFVIAGEPLEGQEIFQHGPFVMDSQQGIKEAFEDYRNARGGFEGAQQWKSGIGGR